MKEKISSTKKGGEFTIEGTSIFAPDAVIMLGEAMRAVFSKFADDGVIDMQTCVSGAVKYCLASGHERAEYVNKTEEMLRLCKQGDAQGLRDMIRDTFAFNDAEVN